MKATLYQVDGPLENAKRQARQAAKARRSGAAQAVPNAGAALAERVFDDVPLPAVAVVSGFWPLQDEIDARPLLDGLHARGHRVCLPAVIGPGQPLEFRAWSPGDDLQPAGFGTSEPGPDKAVLVPHLLLVPLLAFDRAGYRLGYGGGFYDRSLLQLRRQGEVLAVGVAYAAQECAAVPHDERDQRLDWIVTERESIEVGQA